MDELPLNATVLTIVACYLGYLVVARLFLSPLAQFPGPKLAALSNWYEFYYDVLQQGQFTAHIQKLHNDYGVSAFLFIFLPCFRFSLSHCLSLLTPSRANRSNNSYGATYR